MRGMNAPRRNRLSWMGAAAAAAMLLAACGGSAAPAASSASSPAGGASAAKPAGSTPGSASAKPAASGAASAAAGTVRLMELTPSPDPNLSYALETQELGLFQKHGVNVEIQHAGGGGHRRSRSWSPARPTSP